MVESKHALKVERVRGSKGRQQKWSDVPILIHADDDNDGSDDKINNEGFSTMK